MVKVTDKQWNGSKCRSYAIPRIRLMFLAEDPNIFVARVKEAFEERQKTEALLRYCIMTVLLYFIDFIMICINSYVHLLIFFRFFTFVIVYF